MVEHKWIKVEDQLPKKWKMVWIYSESEEVLLGFHGTLWFNDNGRIIDFVTHWCELIIPDKPE